MVDKVLLAAAAAILARPVMAGRGSPEEFVAEHGPAIRELLLTSAPLRTAVSARLPGGDGLVQLLLHPDDATAAAAWRLAEGRAEIRRVRRLESRLKEVRRQRDVATGRHANAVEELRREREANRELSDRAALLDTELNSLRSRLREPRTIAALLLARLESRPSRNDTDSAGRDPKEARPASDPLGGTGVDTATFLELLRRVVDPPPAAPPVVRVTRERDLRVTPLGGGTRIGGSCLLVEAGGTRILVDAGTRPGEPARPPEEIGQALAAPVDAVVITHAHNDHCGYVPALAARVPGLRVIGTPETVQLLPVMWADSVKVMSAGGEPPLYGSAEVGDAVRRSEELAFGARRRIGDLTVELFPAGHILGAAGVVVTAGDSRVVITGDVSAFDQESVSGLEIPDSARFPDLLVMESTCCGDDHPSREDAVRDLVTSVEEVYAGGGTVLIPAFALGRAQELALIMRRRLPHVPTRVDGLAADLCARYESLTAGGARPLTILGGNVTDARTPDARRQPMGRGVVISTSGMLSGGPAVRWATRLLPHPENAVFLAGFQAQGSPGRTLSEAPPKIALTDETGAEHVVEVRARVELKRLSAHADRAGLLDVADQIRAGEVMLVHGVAHRQDRFREVLRLRRHTTVPTARWEVGQPSSL